MAPTTTSSMPTTTAAPELRPRAVVPRRFLALADAVAADGIDRHAASVDELVAVARRLGGSSVLVDVVADAGEPAVARERALGRLLAAWAAPERPSEVATTDVAGHATAA